MPKAFEKLEKKIQKEYTKKGYSTNEAKKIGYATAGKIYRMKK